MALGVLVTTPTPSTAGQLAATAEVQGAVYPREPIGRTAIESEVRGWASVDYDRSLSKAIEVSGDVIVYGSNRRGAILDGEAKIVWRGNKAAVAAGLLRERWGRFADSPLDLLGASNTPYSLVHAEERLSQPTVRATAFFESASLDVYALVGDRRQPLPDHDQRFGFGVPTSDVVRRGGLGDQALAVRLSGTQPALDWAAHVFAGLSRRPTFVPRFTADGTLAGIDAVYTGIVQVAGEAETTRADWRFVAEGFVRDGALDVTGQERTYAYVAAAAEYQRLGAFNGAYNVIPRFELLADTRGDRADIPFASAVRAGMRIATTSLRPVQVEAGYSYDWAFHGHGFLASLEKTLAESPTVNLGFRMTMVSAGSTRSILDVWKDDLELFGFVRIEVSR